MNRYSICDLPYHDRPRERMVYIGSEFLSTTELIAVILGSGSRTKSVLELAHEIMGRFGSIKGLVDATLAEMCEINGLGKSKALQLKAALSLGMRASKIQMETRVKIAHPMNAYNLIKEELEDEKREHLVTLLLDTKGYLITKQTISIGSLTQTIAHPREVFYPAVRHKASAMILIHNHPSGDPTPSEQDEVLTKSLASIGELMGIPIKDHIIIGKGRYTSLKQLGFML